MDLTNVTLAQASRLLHSRSLSSGELTDFSLARIAALNPALNAFITVTAGTARAAARQADDERRAGLDRGPLHGIPLALKDLFDTADAPTTAGSKFFRERHPDEDATIVARLRQAGAVLVGKTNLHEWALGATNANAHFGRANNPWDLERTPGGSSGGSAAAVAARLCLGALGSDTGGSIRIPSALCGVSGLKPTFGRVSLHGVVPLSWFMDHAGPMAQTAEDCAILLNAIAGYDPLDPASVDIPARDFVAALSRPLAGLRIGLPRGYFEEAIDEEVLSAVEAAAKTMEANGGRIVDKPMPFAEEMFLANRTLLAAEAAAYHAERLAARPEDLGADVRARLQAGAAIPAAEYVRARRSQVELTRALELWFGDADLCLTPTTRVPAPHWPKDPLALTQNLTAFTAPFNLTGSPALSIPCGFTRGGLPIGLQIVGRRWDETTVLAAGHQYQRLTDWHTRRAAVGRD